MRVNRCAMSRMIDQAFDDAIAAALDANERAILLDTKRVSEIVRGIQSASDRQTVIAVLEKFDTLVDLADAVGERRVIPFPTRISSQKT